MGKDVIYGYIVLSLIVLFFWWKHILFFILYVAATIIAVAYIDQKEALKEKETSEEGQETVEVRGGLFRRVGAKLASMRKLFTPQRQVVILAVVGFVAIVLVWRLDGLAALQLAKGEEADVSIRLESVHVQREKVVFNIAGHRLDVPAKISTMDFKMDTFRGAPSQHRHTLSKRLEITVAPRFGANLADMSGDPYKGWHSHFVGICDYEVVISDKQQGVRIARFIIISDGKIVRHSADFPWPPNRTGGRAKFAGDQKERQWGGSSRALNDRHSRSAIRIDFQSNRSEMANGNFTSKQGTTAVELRYPAGELKVSVKPL